MGITRHDVTGYDDLIKKLEQLKEQKKIMVYFGAEWCPDCREAWPQVEKALQKYDAGHTFHFIRVECTPTYVEWKNPKCPFRMDTKMQIMQIPTIILYNSPKRLDGDQCNNPDLLDMIFVEEPDE